MMPMKIKEKSFEKHLFILGKEADSIASTPTSL